MLGAVAGYAEHHNYLGSPQLAANVQKPSGLYKAKKKWVKVIRPRKKKYPMVIKSNQ